MRSIKDMVSGNQTVQIVRYHNQQLWYKTECGFEFPVPISDTGNAQFLAQDRAMLFMRYIRKHVNTISQVLAETA